MNKRIFLKKTQSRKKKKKNSFLHAIVAELMDADRSTAPLPSQ
jgi:hypothetical protein